MKGRTGLLVRHSLLDFSIGSFPGCSFVGICLAQGREPGGHILIGGFYTLVDGIDTGYQVVVHLLDDLILGRISPQPVSRFFGQSRIQFGHIVADSVGGFHDGSILYGGIILAHIGIRSFLLQRFLHIGDPGIQSRIGSFTGSSFIINIGLQLFIRIFQISNRIFALTCFFLNGIGIGFNLGI